MKQENIFCKLVGFDPANNTVQLQLPNKKALGGAVMGQRVELIAFVECELPYECIKCGGAMRKTPKMLVCSLCGTRCKKLNNQAEGRS